MNRLPPAQIDASASKTPRRPLQLLSAALGQFWNGNINLGRIGLIVAAPVLLWVFYTTSSGMIDIMRKDAGDWLGVAGALVATSAVLVMLAATSWSLGVDLAALIARRRMARERMIIKTAVTTAVFLFVFSISAFFSFTFYYNNIFKLSSRKIVAQLQPMELATEVILPATKEIAAVYDAASEKIVTSPSYQSYLSALDALIDAARHASPALRETIRKGQEAQQEALARAARQAAAEIETARAATRQLEEARVEIAYLEKSASDLETIIQAKQDEINSLTTLVRQEEQLAVDAAHGLDNMGAACGPNCHMHQLKAEESLKRISAIRRTLTNPLNERTEALKRRDALATQMITLKQKAEAATQAATSAAPISGAITDLDATLRDLILLRDQLGVDPNWARIYAAKPLCAPILAAFRQANISASLVDVTFSCEPQGPSRDLLSAREDILTARASFNQKCGIETGLRDTFSDIISKIRAAPATDSTAVSSGFNTAKTVIDSCIVSGKSAGLTDEDIRQLLNKSDAYLRAHSTERNKFELAREAFWSFTPDSNMAIYVAMAQDLFLFIMKFLAEIFKRSTDAKERKKFLAPIDLTDDEDDATDIRAMKALLRVAQPRENETSAIDPQTPAILELNPNVRENLIALLNRMVRDDAAHIDRKGVYIADNATITEIEAGLFSVLKPRAARSLNDALNTSARSDSAQNFYSDPTAGQIHRRRPSALARYLQ
jgi:uncharacterized protein YecE (DUF72 family)